jgi:hypothetical protein
LGAFQLHGGNGQTVAQCVVKLSRRLISAQTGITVPS